MLDDGRRFRFVPRPRGSSCRRCDFHDNIYKAVCPNLICTEGIYKEVKEAKE